jgi:dienelactone hydrolase
MQPRNGHAVLTNREYVYRSAFELGRHLIGYELQKVLAAVDWFERESGGKDARIGVIGWGEGGLLALYAAALDTRIDAACVSGYFNSRQNVWQEPLDRNVFGLLEQFGDAELATLVAPRALWIEACRGPELELPGKGGAPARLVSPVPADVQREHQRAVTLVEGLKPSWTFRLVETPAGSGPGSAEAIAGLLESLAAAKPPAAAEGKPELLVADFDPLARQQRQIAEIDDHNQWLLEESPYVRAEFMAKLDTSSPEKYQATSEDYRKFFRDEVIGRFDDRVLPANPRTRKICETPQWTGYDVVLDVYPELIAYGILCVPKNIGPGEKRPVVVCQHGLEGRPRDVVDANNPAYHDFAARLADRGFITFSPQNLYIFQDRFRTLQRKANPLKKTLFSMIVPQHQQIVDWLKTVPIVDPNRIAFYGLSYGGKSAMRIPSLVTDYCLSICSGDFNDWVWKNAATRGNYSYVWTGEYEIFEFDLGSTFNYSEMAALIAPRPFMVERGHFDGVGSDERVGLEYAKVRHLYAARLGMPDRTEIEWFAGPHTINGQGTYKFLHRQLNWPEPRTAGGKD